MPFFQNPFTSDFEGNLVLADRGLSLKFKVPGNKGRGETEIISYGKAPYDLSGNDEDGDAKNVLVLDFALSGNDFKNWSTLSVTISASSLAATTPEEVANSLNGNAEFASRFTALVASNNVMIRQTVENTNLRFYVRNGRAEESLLFNKKAGVTEIPSYFARHTMDNRFNFDDCTNQLVFLDVDNSTVATNVVVNAVDYKGSPLNLSATPVADYVLLKGRSGLFMFQKNTVDGSGRITEIIEYQAGSVVGDFARKTTYAYSGANTNPDQVTEEPHVLETGDLITP